jgi:uncharacterized protein YggT (Ycf19 family)
MRSNFVDSHGYLGRSRSRWGALARVERVVDYLFGVLYLLILIRFALELFRARPEAGFSEGIARLTAPFVGPFIGLFSSSSTALGRVDWSLLVALAAYVVVHAVVRGLLRIVATL